MIAKPNKVWLTAVSCLILSSAFLATEMYGQPTLDIQCPAREFRAVVDHDGFGVAAFQCDDIEESRDAFARDRNADFNAGAFAAEIID